MKKEETQKADPKLFLKVFLNSDKLRSSGKPCSILNVVSFFIKEEQQSIKVAMHSFGKDFAQVLMNAKSRNRALKCSVIYDEKVVWQNLIDKMKNSGIVCKPAPKLTTSKLASMHEKFIICGNNKSINGPLVALSSANMTARNAGTDDNAMMVTNNSEVICFFEQEFSRLSGNDNEPEFYDLASLSKKNLLPYVSPHISTILEQLIAIEDGWIVGVCFRFTLDNLAQMLAAKKDIQPSPYLILDSSIKSEDNDKKAVNTLLNSNAMIFVHTAPDKDHQMHHKFWLFFSTQKKYNPRVLFGSFNPTNNARYNNWEKVVLCQDKDVFDRFGQEFLRLLEKPETKLREKLL